MKRSLVILLFVLGCSLIGIMMFIYRANQESQGKNPEIESEMNQENFDTLDQGVWTVSSKTLGRTLLNPENVVVKDGFLNIRMPADTLTGGEIASQQLSTYGSYESRIKLPEASSSITGFFL